MKRTPGSSAAPLFLDRSAVTPLWQQISIGFRTAIANGRLRAGARVPSTRELARLARVSRNTVLAAYVDLAARGLLLSRTGSGSFVAPGAGIVPPVQRWFQDSCGNPLALSPLP